MLGNKTQLLSDKGICLKAINNIVSLSWNDHRILRHMMEVMYMWNCRRVYPLILNCCQCEGHILGTLLLFMRFLFLILLEVGAALYLDLS